MAGDINQERLFNSTNSISAFNNIQETHNALKEFEANTLSDETAVSSMSANFSSGKETSEATLDYEHLKTATESVGVNAEGYQIFLINRFLVHSKRLPIPHDSSKLRISSQAFRDLISNLRLPAAFLYALSRYHLPCGRGFFTFDSLRRDDIIHELWYFLPLRIQYKCNDKAKEHIGSTASSNQMNPFHYLLHLSDVGLDIRGSRIAVFCRYSSGGKSMVTVVVNFMDGRWSKSALEPKKRIKESWNTSARSEPADRPFDIHCIYFTSALRWWTNALDSVNEQLMAYERRLQEAIDTDTQPNAFGTLNRALHAVAAHLHRYNTELESMQETLLDIIKRHQKYTGMNCLQKCSQEKFGTMSDDLEHIASHLKQIRAFLQELMDKVQNNLALLFNCIQIANDRGMVANGEKIHAILLATQDEAKSSKEIAEQSVKLSKEMRQDSVAMRTIAVTTMFFLPGTSFATFFSMPFFSTTGYLDNPQKCWIWLICTIPSTIIAFAFYFYWRHREQAQKKREGLL